MAKKEEYRISTGVLKRFLRVWVPQLALLIPGWVAIVNKFDLPDNLFWVTASLTFVAALVTALDKLFRELHWY